MAGEWERVALGEVAINHDARRIPVKEADRKPGKYPYYGASGIVDYVDDYLFDGEYLLVAEDGENLRTRQTPIAFMAKGRFWVNNHAHILEGSAKALTRFLHYALLAADIQPYLTGAVMPKLTQANLHRIPLMLPPKEEQENIVALLGALDDRIELNRRMAETLEAMARALFRSWFVDFDPVRAKTEGRPTGLPDDLAALFPDCFGDDGFPAGWSGNAGSIGELARVTVEPREVEPETPYLGLEHFDQRHLVIRRWGQAAEVDSVKMRFAAGDLLFGKLRPYFHKVAIAPFSGICSSDIFVFRPVGEIPRTFLYLTFSEDSFVNAASTASHGTKMPRADWGFLKQQPAALPSLPLLQAFDMVVGPMIGSMLARTNESQTLAALRDTLLPKLISGELRIADAEKRIAAVA